MNETLRESTNRNVKKETERSLLSRVNFSSEKIIFDGDLEKQEKVDKVVDILHKFFDSSTWNNIFQNMANENIFTETIYRLNIESNHILLDIYNTINFSIINKISEHNSNTPPETLWQHIQSAQIVNASLIISLDDGQEITLDLSAPSIKLMKINTQLWEDIKEYPTETITENISPHMTMTYVTLVWWMWASAWYKALTWYTYIGPDGQEIKVSTFKKTIDGNDMNRFIIQHLESKWLKINPFDMSIEIDPANYLNKVKVSEVKSRIQAFNYDEYQARVNAWPDTQKVNILSLEKFEMHKRTTLDLFDDIDSKTSMFEFLKTQKTALKWVWIAWLMVFLIPLTFEPALWNSRDAGNIWRVVAEESAAIAWWYAWYKIANSLQLKWFWQIVWWILWSVAWVLWVNVAWALAWADRKYTIYNPDRHNYFDKHDIELLKDGSFLSREIETMLWFQGRIDNLQDNINKNYNPYNPLNDLKIWFWKVLNFVFPTQVDLATNPNNYLRARYDSWNYIEIWNKRVWEFKSEVMTQVPTFLDKTYNEENLKEEVIEDLKWILTSLDSREWSFTMHQWLVEEIAALVMTYHENKENISKELVLSLIQNTLSKILINDDYLNRLDYHIETFDRQLIDFATSQDLWESSQEINTLLEDLWQQEMVFIRNLPPRYNAFVDRMTRRHFDTKPIVNNSWKDDDFNTPPEDRVIWKELPDFNSNELAIQTYEQKMLEDLMNNNNLLYFWNLDKQEKDFMQELFLSYLNSKSLDSNKELNFDKIQVLNEIEDSDIKDFFTLITKWGSHLNNLIHNFWKENPENTAITKPSYEWKNPGQYSPWRLDNIYTSHIIDLIREKINGANYFHAYFNRIAEYKYQRDFVDNMQKSWKPFQSWE